jgi:PleD family two-component response regulator
MDDPGALMEIRKAARDVGFSVIQVGSPEEALRRLDFLAPVGVIQETLLSGVDGLLLCRKLRAHHRAREVPIVVILSDGCPEEANRAREAGATVVLSRPIKPEDLRSTFQQGSAEPIAQSM